MKINAKWAATLAVPLICGQILGANAQPQQDDGPPHPERLTEEHMSSDEFYLPSINEIYMQAQAFGVSGNWKKVVKIQATNYRTMPLPRRSFEVGKTLSNIAFLVLDTGDRNAAPPKGLVQHAYDAILSLNPPAKINNQLQRLRDQLEAGTLRGQRLREQVDVLMDETVPEIMDTEPKLKDATMLVLGAGYFRAMYLGANTVASYRNPTRDQLAMFRWGSMVDYFIKYFTVKAAANFKNSAEVKSFVIALKKIQRLVNKSPESITKADVSKIAKALGVLFK